MQSNVNSARKLPEARRQAKSFQELRRAHQREMAEDYVELIADLIEVEGEARVVELAERLGVTPATVNNAIARLVKSGLVKKARYRAIFLTDSGRELARKSRERHLLVRDVLMELGVDRDTAEIDTEGIEHHVSPKTLAVFRKFLEGKGKG
jgi:DtxR family manganese transport transcriptional regulator